jgi:membrane-bound serine protease (ClpP class)
LDEVKAQRADLVIIEIDSPGGFLEQSLDIAKRLRDIDWARTVAFVPEMAASGAAFVSLGCDDIIMAPNAVLGDAGPVIQDEDSLFRHAPEKVVSGLAPVVGGMAEAKGRPAVLAEAMIDRDLEVFRVRNRQDGQEKFMSEKQIAADPNPGDWEKLNLVVESQKGRFLTVDGERAVELGLAQGIASTRQELKARYQIKGELPVLEYTAVDTALYILNTQCVTGLLLVIGLIALYVELSAPGIGLGGLVALLCFAIFFWSRILGGTAGWLEAVLFAVGVLFLLVELFLLPGFGVAGLAGLVLLLVSLIMANQTFGFPQKAWQWEQVRDTMIVLFASGVVFTVVAVWFSAHFGAVPLLSRITLRPPDSTGGAAAGGTTAGAAAAALSVGDVGVAFSALRPAGKARFGDQRVNVVTESAFLKKGTKVQIIEIAGKRILVREVGKAD